MLCCVLNPDPGSASNERVKVPFTSCQAFLPPEAHPIFPRLGGRCDGRFSACDLPACELPSQVTQLPWHLDSVPRALPRDHPAVWACEGFGSSRRLPGPPPPQRERESSPNPRPTGARLQVNPSSFVSPKPTLRSQELETLILKEPVATA